MFTPVRLLVTLSLILGPSAQAADVAAPPKLPSKLECWTVRGLYKHYSKHGYTLDQMKGYLSGMGFSEEKIAKAEKCLG